MLFTGLIASHLGPSPEAAVSHFLKDFGLVLFVFVLGMQIAPDFLLAEASGESPERLRLRPRYRRSAGFAYRRLDARNAIVGIILSLIILRFFFKVDVAEDAAAFQREQGVGIEALERMTLTVDNPNLDGIPIGYVPGSHQQSDARENGSRARLGTSSQCHGDPG